MKKDLNVGLKIEKLAANKTNTSYDLFLCSLECHLRGPDKTDKRIFSAI